MFKSIFKPVFRRYLDKGYMRIKVFITSLLFLIMSACSFHPLGIPDEEWEQMTIEQRHDAYMKQQELTRKRLELEKQRNELENQRLAIERQRVDREECSDEILFLDGGIIGGETMLHRQRLVISLGRLVWVDRIDFYAHDNINHYCNGRLNIKVDHFPIALNLDIKKRGRRYSYSIGRQCRKIVFETASMDEVSISNIEIFGSRVKAANGIHVHIH